MTNFGLKGLLLLLAIVLFIVGALMGTDSENKVDLIYWGLAVFAAAFIVESIPFGSMTGPRTRDRP